MEGSAPWLLGRRVVSGPTCRGWSARSSVLDLRFFVSFDLCGSGETSPGIYGMVIEVSHYVGHPYFGCFGLVPPVLGCTPSDIALAPAPFAIVLEYV